MFDTVIQIGIHNFGIALFSGRNYRKLIRYNLGRSDSLRDSRGIRLAGVRRHMTGQGHDTLVMILSYLDILEVGPIQRSAHAVGDIGHFRGGR